MYVINNRYEFNDKTKFVLFLPKYFLCFQIVTEKTYEELYNNENYSIFTKIVQ